MLKKTLFALSFALLIVSCGGNGNKSARNVDEVDDDEVTTTATKSDDSDKWDAVEGFDLRECTKVYSDSYDGFVSIRATASSKGEVVGKFKNGPRPAYVLGQQEQWLEIYYDGVRGFVYEKYTTLEPTVEVTVNVDGDWLEGIYGFNGYTAYLIFDNGTYTYEQEYGTICMGKYRLEGNEIVLTPVLHLMPDLPCEVERHPINVAEKTLGGMGRSAFGVIDPNDEEGCMGEFMITSEKFYAIKKIVKSRL